VLNESDGLRLFLTDAVEAFPGENLTTNEIVEKYAGYCSTHGWNMTMRKTEEQLPDLMMALFHVARSNNIPNSHYVVALSRNIVLTLHGRVIDHGKIISDSS
jgi:hypothetical protein